MIPTTERSTKLRKCLQELLLEPRDHVTYALAAAVVPEIAEAANLGIPPHAHLQNVSVRVIPRDASTS